MDALDQLADPAVVLLARVDDVLSRFGAPAQHPVWRPLRRLRVLPGTAVGAVAALRPELLAAPVAALRQLARRYADAADGLPTAVAWHGPAGSAYAGRVTAFAAHLGAAPGGLADRLDATAGYAEALAGWQRATRQAVAGTLAVALRSGEAVVLSAAAPAAGATELAPAAGATELAPAAGATELVPGAGATELVPGAGATELVPGAGATELALAAAEIGRLVLEAVAAAYDRAEALLADHTALGYPADRAVLGYPTGHAGPGRPPGDPAASGGTGTMGGTLRIDE